jgi:carbamoyl-phosphate synthase large subunit
VSRRGAAARIEAALTDPDPRHRRAAVLVAADRSLRPFAAALAARARVEEEESVRAALIEVVLRNQWEPSDDRHVAELRLWAHATVPRAGGAAPAPPGATGRVEVRLKAVEGPDPAASSVVTLVRPMRPGAARPMPQSDRDPGDGRITTIVTGAGGPAGVAVIRALVAAGHRVMAADADGLAVGGRLAHGTATIPRADHPHFVAALCRLATQAGAGVIVPTVAEELVALAEGRADLEAAGVASWVPDPDAVRNCSDKWRFAQVMQAAGLPVPATAVGTTDGVPGPWVIKPRSGRGSRDVYSAFTEAEAAWALDRVPGALVQSRLEGLEFTVDALARRDGSLAGAVPRWRLETKAGISTRGRTFSDDGLLELVARVYRATGLEGPANVQGFMTLDGTPSFIEVNPRFSGGLPLSLAAGADLVGEYVQGILGRDIRPERLLARPGVVMLRHFEEIFE